MSKVRDLYDWLTIADAAAYLSASIAEPVRVSDVLRLGLEGRLTLSLRLLRPAYARFGSYDEDDVPAFRSDTTSVEMIDGVWDLPMFGVAASYIEGLYLAVEGEPPREPWGSLYIRQGARFARVQRRRDGVAFSYDAAAWVPEYDWPAEGMLVVRRSALDEFVRQQFPPQVKPSRAELSTKERDTYLLMIDGLLAALNIPTGQAYKAAQMVSAMVERRGSSLSVSTIAKRINQIPDALERRGKLSR